jgi:hypothetical protein
MVFSRGFPGFYGKNGFRVAFSRALHKFRLALVVKFNGCHLDFRNGLLITGAALVYPAARARFPKRKKVYKDVKKVDALPKNRWHDEGTEGGGIPSTAPQIMSVFLGGFYAG